MSQSLVGELTEENMRLRIQVRKLELQVLQAHAALKKMGVTLEEYPSSTADLPGYARRTSKAPDPATVGGI